MLESNVIINLDLEMNCIFCQIVSGSKPAKIFWENEEIIAFQDIFPKANVHLLVCPKEHYERLTELPEGLILRLFQTIREIAANLGITDNFRLILNNGAQAGQIIEHLHFHFLSNAHDVKLKFKSPG